MAVHLLETHRKMVLDCWWWRRGFESWQSRGERAGEGYRWSEASCQLLLPSPLSTFACIWSSSSTVQMCALSYSLGERGLQLFWVHWSCVFRWWRRPRPSSQLETLAFCWCWAGRGWRPAGQLRTPSPLLGRARNRVAQTRFLCRKTAGCNRRDKIRFYLESDSMRRIFARRRKGQTLILGQKPSYGHWSPFGTGRTDWQRMGFPLSWFPPDRGDVTGSRGRSSTWTGGARSGRSGRGWAERPSERRGGAASPKYSRAADIPGTLLHPPPEKSKFDADSVGGCWIEILK